MDVYVGLDIGGTKFLVAVADAAGQILHQVRESTPQDLDEGLALLEEMIEMVAGGDRILGMGAAIGGPLDWRRGVVSPLHQPAWRDVPLRAIMEEQWGCPFHVDVDTNVAAMGEYGACDDPPGRLLYITLSTGMGGGFIVDGRIYRGTAGAHPEIGHQAINFRCRHPERVTCDCGIHHILRGLCIIGTTTNTLRYKEATMKTKPARDRLSEKNCRGLLVNHLRTRYAFSPAMADVLAEDALYLRTISAPGSRQDGQVIRYAVKNTEPAGKALKDCEYEAVTLTLHHPDDIAYCHQHGLLELRRHILKRISDEAVAQGAPLTQEDLGALLFIDRGTVADYAAVLEAREESILTRAHFTDAGRAVTHKRPIIQLRLLGVPETEIARRTGHTLPSVERYIDGLLRVALPHRHGDAPQLISRITGFSLFLVNEYIALHDELAEDKNFAIPLRKFLDFYADGLLPRQAKKGG